MRANAIWTGLMAVRENGVWLRPLKDAGKVSFDERLIDALPKHFRDRWRWEQDASSALAAEVQAIIDEFPGLSFEPTLRRVVEALG